MECTLEIQRNAKKNTLQPKNRAEGHHKIKLAVLLYEAAL